MNTGYMERENWLNTEIETDLQLLVDCLKCQTGDPVALKQSLVAIANTCCINSGAQDWMRDTGSLEFIFKMMITTSYPEVKEATLYCIACAVEKNVYSQKQLGTAKMYAFLHGYLSQQTSNRTQRTIVYLLLCLTASNSNGQMLMRKSGCLRLLFSMFLQWPWTEMNFGSQQEQSWFEAIEGPSVDLWTSVVSLLCVSINNPQNDENQRQATRVFPQALMVLQQVPHQHVAVKSVSKLLSLAVSGNVYNQERLVKCGGVEALMNALHCSVNRLAENTDYTDTAVHVATALDSIITGNSTGSRRAGELGLVPLILKLMKLQLPDPNMLTQIILTLAHCLDACDSNQKEFIDCDGMEVLANYLMDNNEEDVSNAVKYILSITMKTKSQNRLPMKDVEKLKAKHRILNTKLNDLISSSDSLDEIGEFQKKIDVLAKRLDDASKLYTTVDLNSTQQTLRSEDHNVPAQLGEPSAKYRRSSVFQEDAFKAARAATNALCTDPGVYEEVQSVGRSSCLSSVKPMSEVSFVIGKAPNAHQRKSGADIHQHGRTVPSRLVGEDHLTRNQNSHIPLQQNIDLCQRRHFHSDLHQKTDLPERQHPLRVRDEGTNTGLCYEDKEKCSHCDNFCRDCVQYNNSNCPAGSGYRVPITPTLTSPNLQSWPCKSGHNYQHDNNKIPLTHLHRHENSPSLKRSCVTSSCQHHDKQDDHVQSHRCHANVCECFADRMSSGAGDAGVSLTEHCQLPVTDSIRDAEHLPLDLSRPQHIVYKVTETNENCRTPQPAHSTFVNLNSTRILSAGNTFIKEKSSAIVSPIPILTKNMPTSSAEPVNLSSDDVSNLHNSNQENVTICPYHENKRSDMIPDSAQTFKCHNTVQTPKHQTLDQADSQFVKPVAPVKKAAKRMKRQSDPALVGNLRWNPRQSSTPVKQSSHLHSKSVTATRIDKDYDGGLSVDIQHPNTSNEMSSYTRNLLAVNRKLLLDKDDAFESRQSTQKENTYRQSEVKKDRKCQKSNTEESFLINLVDDFDVMSVCGDEIEEMALDMSIAELFEAEHAESEQSTKTRKRKSQSQCPVCLPGLMLDGQPLNSRTYNIILETNSATCSDHRSIRNIERSYITKQRKENLHLHDSKKSRLLPKVVAREDENLKKDQNTINIYDFDSSSPSSQQYKAVSPANSSSASSLSPASTVLTFTSTQQRRERVPYTDQEVFNLKHGVANHGRFWTDILNTYQFHPSRTSVDLKEKYARLKQKEKINSGTNRNARTDRVYQPFSLCEDRRLKRGVSRFGCNWKNILSSYRFSKQRTAEELRNRWRCLHKKSAPNTK